MSYPLWNKWQPLRPRLHPTRKIEGSPAPLLFATMPKLNRERLVVITSPAARIAQMRLYRAARAGDVPEQVSIAELHEYCFGDIPEFVSKTQMGYMVVSSLIYEPRKLINRKDVGKPTMSYVFRTDLDFQYGLEWMICSWLGRFFKEAAAQEAIPGPDEMADELDALANSDETMYREFYEEPSYDWALDEPNWFKLTQGFSEQVPPSGAEHRPERRSAPPRDLSKL